MKMRLAGMKKHLASLRESVVDGVADIRSHWSRTILQLVGIVLGVVDIFFNWLIDRLLLE